jgi:hypothetical protein
MKLLIVEDDGKTAQAVATVLLRQAVTNVLHNAVRSTRSLRILSGLNPIGLIF